jgi:hypothetical protein
LVCGSPKWAGTAAYKQRKHGDGNGPVTPIVNKIHFCTTCNTDTIWCRDTKDPTKAFCCKCGEIEDLAAEALLD